MASKFIVREITGSDRDYIAKTVLFSYFDSSACVRKNNRDSFFTGHNKVINALLDHAKTLVIADPEDSDLIYGFIIFEQSVGQYDIIHYAHIRKDFRGLGLLKNLVEVIKTKDNLALSHISDDIRPARLKKYYQKVIVDSYVQNIRERI
jgi:hypothetical protein